MKVEHFQKKLNRFFDSRYGQILCIVLVMWTIVRVLVFPHYGRDHSLVKEFASLETATKYRVISADGSLAMLTERRYFQGRLGELLVCLRQYEPSYPSGRMDKVGRADLELENGMRIKLTAHHGVIRRFNLRGVNRDWTKDYAVRCDASLINQWKH